MVKSIGINKFFTLEGGSFVEMYYGLVGFIPREEKSFVYSRVHTYLGVEQRNVYVHTLYGVVVCAEVTLSTVCGPFWPRDYNLRTS